MSFARARVVGAIFITLLFSGCGESKYTQCEQIFQIARQVTNLNQNVNYTASEQPTRLKEWLQAADLMNRAAQQIESLHIDDAELIEYQNKFANIYQTYSRATYDAVIARENRNLDALQAARTQAVAAGQIQEKLLDKINSYCVAKTD